MSHFVFHRDMHKIELLDHANVALTIQYTAFNLVDSHSKGEWPDGTFGYAGYNAHAEVADPDSEYGSYGIFVFNVPGRVGMGVHSGRADIRDGLGRMGPQHCTLGCIRTTDNGMDAFVEIVRRDPLESITLVSNGAAIAAVARSKRTTRRRS